MHAARDYIDGNNTVCESGMFNTWRSRTTERWIRGLQPKELISRRKDGH